LASPSPSYRLEEILALNDELIALTRAQYPLDLHLARLSQGLRGRQRQLAEDLSQRMAAGESIDEAIAQLGQGFPPMYRAVVTAGLRSGNLTAALEDIAATARRVQELRNSYLTAAAYPAVILILVGVFAATVGVQQLEEMRQVGVQSNVSPNEFPLNVIAWFQMLAPVGLILAPIGGVMLLLVLLLQIWPSALFLGNGFVVNFLPGARRIALDSKWATIFEVMALLLKNGCPLPQAIRLATAAPGDTRLARHGEKWAAQIEAGNLKSAPRELNPLSRWLVNSKQPPLALAGSLKLLSDRYHGKAIRRSQWVSNQLPLYATLVLGGGATLAYAALLIIPWISVLYHLVSQTIPTPM